MSIKLVLLIRHIREANLSIELVLLIRHVREANLSIKLVLLIRHIREDGHVAFTTILDSVHTFPRQPEDELPVITPSLLTHQPDHLTHMMRVG